MSRSVSIGGRLVGVSYSPYIICEISGNHNGDIGRALALVDAAAETGCDCIKLQTYTPDTITLDCNTKDFYIEGGLWDGRRLYDLYEEAHTPFEWHEKLFERARSQNIQIISTPFDRTAVDLLESLDVPAYKIASFEIVDLPLIRYVASKGKPMIISTGLANLAEIQEALNAAQQGGCNEIILLHCISSYPAPTDQSNLRIIPHLSETFDVVAGLSDHTEGTAVSVASIALGSAVIEKHFTLARADGGPDSAFSLEPEEFIRLTAECRDAWTALGSVDYSVKRAEQGSFSSRRSIYVAQDIKAGEVFTETNIRSVRPGYGLSLKYYDSVIGKTSTQDLLFGDRLEFKHIADFEPV